MFPSWSNISVNSQNYLYDLVIEDDGYKLLWTDMKDLFQEKLNAEEFSSKFAHLNPDLEDCDNSEGLKEIESILTKIATCDKVDVRRAETGLEIELDWSSDGLPWRWIFNLERQSSQSFQTNVTSSLTETIQLLLNQRNQLFRIIRDKDLEIDDYFASGAKLSRNSLKTEWFTQEKFLAGTQDFNPKKTCLEVIASDDVRTAIEQLNTFKDGCQVDGGKDEEKVKTRIKELTVENRKDDSLQEEKLLTPPKRKFVKPTFKLKDGEKRKKANHLKNL